MTHFCSLGQFKHILCLFKTIHYIFLLKYQTYSNLPLFLAASAFCFSLSTDSPYVALLLGLEVFFRSGLIIHQEDFPASSFGIFRNFWCNDRLWRIEFWNSVLCQFYLKKLTLPSTQQSLHCPVCHWSKELQKSSSHKSHSGCDAVLGMLLLPK